MTLTDKAIKSAKPAIKIRKLYDGGGLLLLVHPNGRKYWSFKYRFLGKEKSLGLGVYPEVSLAEARAKLIDLRKQVANNSDPSEVRKATKRDALIAAENGFESVAREWIEKKRPAWTPKYAEFTVKRLEVDIFPKLGRRPIAAISPPELLSVVRIIEKRGATELAHRMLNVCGQIFMFGIATSRVERNPAADLKGALTVHVKKNFAHLKEEELPKFLRELDNYQGSLQTRLAAQLGTLTFLRPGELRYAAWKEIDLEKAEWRIDADRTKKRRGHIVPLSRQAVAILKQLQSLNGHWTWVFPNPQKPIKPMSENAVLHAIYQLGYRGIATGHGFRHTASTILNEHRFNPDHVERQLAHVEKNKVRGTYNQAEYLSQRREMMQWWADHLDHLREKSDNARG